ncbi:hypothetical protein [Nonomuraea gerenzanensis]|uniref:Uncharacterized protein n=1 Tax=Nonomuraea gerenzanensis TaxID=93944 RepID=A0A1M4BKZ4_9ACTN|nr:hypothetical protein [Nonomuraea gerenzanensis]UBU19204.1 hypothetical protein LCN96_56135 [Nonomuraea gerenzanensis]SAP16347.1 hypothetical protein BN4615_P11010 [Nonomuraea gerenzanensis]
MEAIVPGHDSDPDPARPLIEVAGQAIFEQSVAEQGAAVEAAQQDELAQEAPAELGVSQKPVKDGNVITPGMRIVFVAVVVVVAAVLVALGQTMGGALLLIVCAAGVALQILKRI